MKNNDLFMAREEFLSMIADGELKLEADGDEGSDCSTFTLTTGWSQMRDFIDALGLPDLPKAEQYCRAESDITEARIIMAVETPAEPPKPQPEEKLAAYAEPAKCQGCSEPPIYCETCALDLAEVRVEEALATGAR